VLAVFSALNAFLSMLLIGTLAALTHSSLIFPSLGPTAFLFFYTPRAPSASPRNAILGHALGCGAGYFSLWVTGLLGAPQSLADMTVWRGVCAALALALTAAGMILCRAPHPPAAATTLIVALGILTRPIQLLVVLAGVVLLTVQALATNRLVGLNYPLWAPPCEPLPHPEAPPVCDIE
jgi:CBS-domain-containing membrane protein